VTSYPKRKATFLPYNKLIAWYMVFFDHLAVLQLMKKHPIVIETEDL
jgi:hypothetical protein